MFSVKYLVLLISSSPNRVLYIVVNIKLSCQYEEIIAETVDVGGNVIVNNSSRLSQSQYAAFCFATDCSTDMGKGSCA